MFPKKSLLFIFATVFLSSNAVVPVSPTANEIQQRSKTQTSFAAALYPQATSTRDLKTLDGVWNFRTSPDALTGFKYGWYEQDLEKTGPVIPMPVPSSYNDIGEDASLRDHVGIVWYDRRFYVPPWWLDSKQRIWLRFSSVHYAAKVYVNKQLVMSHEIGHLPFEVEITDVVKKNSSNLLTVAVDNTLSSTSVPQGYVYDDLSAISGKVQTYTFDFFNYAGLHRTVFLYTTPQTYIDDVIVNTDKQGLTGFVIYNVTFQSTIKNVNCVIEMFDKNDTRVGSSSECVGLIEIDNANFWWPYLMDPSPGYLYTFKANLVDLYGNIIDTYAQKIGIRTMSWTNKSIFINDKPLYLKGFGMHEDSDLRGKGWDPVLWVKNFNLIKWLGANAFRTSHYPYAEEIYHMADEHGIMIIDECPSGDTDIFSPALLANHKRSLTELIRRDKNHPSVIMWSISNEARTQRPAADEYFGEVVKHVKSMDLSRPVTMAIAQPYNVDKAGQHLDVISFNRYNAWYHDTGRIEVILPKVTAEANNWFKKYNKPVLMSEYGADTVAGLHMTPVYAWSEEFQVACLSEHFKAFDSLRQSGFFVGEFIWNFADFMTPQTSSRPGGNKKGIFTRARQPKAVAFLVRQRYNQLANSDSGADTPSTAYYVSDGKPVAHDEL